ncbi:MAG TPA: hypothetical protein ENG14_04285 [Thermodesulforhabdus norvegica]|uniref:Uncharacterized protein n=1 Tax=Thermodesulforhabdus norvegica TaxID=39841 RepID=A0A7C1AYJ3_9BACT|nr:hypothetical protein [Thermodesulforhabdus norvegica]
MQKKYTLDQYLIQEERLKTMGEDFKRIEKMLRLHEPEKNLIITGAEKVEIAFICSANIEYVKGINNGD